MSTVVGIPCRSFTTPVRNLESCGVIRTYVDAVTCAGGTVLLLPPQPPDRSLRALDSCDALLLTGGESLAPGPHWGAGHAPDAGTDFERDEQERALFLEALQRKLPILGICRGLQLITCALGGTLQVTPDSKNTLAHIGPDGSAISHSIVVQGGRWLRGILAAGNASVLSRHTSSILTPAPSTEVVARSNDGLIEAIELRNDVRCLAVQWHPEIDAAQARSPGLDIFQWLTAF